MNVFSACMFGLSQHPLSRVCHHSNPASDTSRQSLSNPVSTHSDSTVFPQENVCQPSSLQFKLRSIKTRLNWLQTVIDGQKKSTNPGRHVKTPQISIGHELLHTTVGIFAAGLRQNLVEDSMYWNRATLQTNTERGSVVRDVPFVYTTFLDTLLESRQSRPVIGFSAGGSEASVTFERERLHGEGGEGHDCRSRGTEASKEEIDTTNDDRVQHRVQLWSGIQSDDQRTRLLISLPFSVLRLIQFPVHVLWCFGVLSKSSHLFCMF